MNEIALALGLVTTVITEGASVLQTLQTAASQNRTTLTATEWQAMLASAKRAHAALEQAIAAGNLVAGS